jgi:hypothetical protein
VTTQSGSEQERNIEPRRLNESFSSLAKTLARDGPKAARFGITESKLRKGVPAEAVLEFIMK